MVLIYWWRGAGKEPSWRVGLVSGHEIPDLRQESEQSQWI